VFTLYSQKMSAVTDPAKLCLFPPPKIISKKAKSPAICLGKSLLKRCAAFRFFGFRRGRAILLRKIT
jgi:hypothetical protein